MSETGGIERPRRKKRKKGKSKLSTEQRAVSYVIGGGLFLLGVGLLVWFSRLDRAPGKIFNLLAAGGVGSLLSGLGLFLHPLTRSGWTPFRTIPIRSRCSASCPGSGSSGCWSSSPRWGGASFTSRRIRCESEADAGDRRAGRRSCDLARAGLGAIRKGCVALPCNPAGADEQ